MRHHSFWLLLFLFYTSLLTAQELPPIINYSTNDYNAGNQNWMITQSPEKIIYAANNNGLLEFNGAQWTLYPSPNGSIMRSVKSDTNRIYTGCYMDFGYWQRDRTNRLQYTSLVKQTKLKIKEDEQFWEIFVEDGYVLFQSLDAVYSYDLRSEKITTIVTNTQINKFFKVNDRFFYQDLSQGLFEIKNGKATLIQSNLIYRDQVLIKMFSVNSQIYFITSNNSIFKIVSNKPVLIAANGFKEDIRVYSAMLLTDGSLVIGTISHGLFNINLNGSINFHLDAATGLANNTVLSLYEDVDNNIWTGLDNGLSYLNFESPFKIFKDQNGTLGTVHASLYESDFLYLGTNQGLFVKKKGDVTFNLIKNTQGQVWSLKKINGSIFCGHNDGTFLVNQNTATRISNIAGVWDLQPIAERDNLIIQGTYSGLYILENKNNNWKLRNKIAGFNTSTKDFAQNNHTIYVSHEYKGVFKLETDRLYQNILNTTLIKNLKKGNTSDIIEDAGDILYANINGVFIKAKNQKDFKKEETLSALYNDGYISSTLIKDAETGFWIFTKNNIYKIFKQQINNRYSIKTIPLPIYVRSEKKGYENISHAPNGTYLLGSSYGYMVMDINQKRKIVPEVFINEISHSKNGKTTRYDLSKPIELSYADNNFTVYYHAAVYEGHHSLLYRFKLDKDDSWSTWTTASSADFKNVNFGTYDFQVQTMINSIASPNTAHHSIQIQRPFYLSNLAIVIYVILTLAFLGLINIFYTAHFKKQKEQALKKQQKELELKSLQNEKDIIKLRNENLKADIEMRNRELAVSTMSMIKKNETLHQIKTALENLQNNTQIKSVKKLVEDNLSDKQDWISFEKAFNNADKNFFKKVKEIHPNLTSSDLRLCVYLRLNLSSKEIAPLLNISPRSVEIKRYRLRKKITLEHDQDLNEYFINL